MVWTEASDKHLSTHVVEGYPKVRREANCIVQEYVFDTPWEVVIHAHESRYPTHPDLPLMIASAVVSRDTSQEHAWRELFTRKIVLQTAVPRLLASLVGGESMEFEERWDIDRQQRTARKIGRNLSFRGDTRWAMRLDETLEFTVHPDRPDWVMCRQRATLELPSMPWGLGDMATDFFASNYIEGISRARRIDQTIIEELVRKGGNCHPASATPCWLFILVLLQHLTVSFCAWLGERRGSDTLAVGERPSSSRRW